MRVPDDILKCNVFLCVHTGKDFEPGGTAYFVSVPSETTAGLYAYLVTAKHCIIQAKQKYGDLFIRLNRRDGGLQLIRIDSDWIFPEDTSVDLAVLPIALDTANLDVKFVDKSLMATPEILDLHSIGIGDEVFISGLFTKHYGTKKNIPIVRSGIIAAMPDEPVQDRTTGLSYSAYLIEARSIDGLSGSPVFVHLSHVRPSKDGNIMFGSDLIFLIGTIRGHWDHLEPQWQTTVDFVKELEQVNMGIATATPSTELHKIIFGDRLVEHRKKHDEEIKKKLGTTSDSEFPERQMSKEEFEEALKKASRKIDSSQKPQ